MMVDASLSLFGALSLSGDVAHFLVLLGLLALGLYVFAAVGASRPGRALLACREDAVAAQACGIDRPGVRSAAFGISAGLSALAGAVYAHYSGFISPAQFDLELSLKALLYLVIGGPGRMVAPLAAVLILETILAHVHFLGEAKVLFHGLLLGAALLVDQGWWRGALVGAKKLGRIPGQGIM
jgi:branched-chain amino acid transport system permease protein